MTIGSLLFILSIKSVQILIIYTTNPFIFQQLKCIQSTYFDDKINLLKSESNEQQFRIKNIEFTSLNTIKIGQEIKHSLISNQWFLTFNNFIFIIFFRKLELTVKINSQVYLSQQQKSLTMINEITCNSNNTIELSRGELLQWINNILKINYTKIEQLGSGAAYCQLLDLIYPGKIPMSKVNWKAKHEYQYVNNFKVLQQSFVKLNVMRHVDVQKLVKCKYQDNLEFLQWFKKIFDTAVSLNKQYNPLTRRGERNQEQSDKIQKYEKENKIPESQLQMQYSEGQNISDIMREDSTPKYVEDMIKKQTLNTEKPKGWSVNQESPRKNMKFMGQIQSNIENKLIELLKQRKKQEMNFHLTKICSIEDLMTEWDTEKTSTQLIEQIRKIILGKPEDKQSVEDGEIGQKQQVHIQNQVILQNNENTE